MQMARSRAQPIKWEYFWRLANQESVILPSLERKLRKNALRLNQSAISNFVLYVINTVISTTPLPLLTQFVKLTLAELPNSTTESISSPKVPLAHALSN